MTLVVKEVWAVHFWRKLELQRPRSAMAGVQGRLQVGRARVAQLLAWAQRYLQAWRAQVALVLAQG